MASKGSLVLIRLAARGLVGTRGRCPGRLVRLVGIDQVEDLLRPVQDAHAEPADHLGAVGPGVRGDVSPAEAVRRPAVEPGEGGRHELRYRLGLRLLPVAALGYGSLWATTFRATSGGPARMFNLELVRDLGSVHLPQNHILETAVTLHQGIIPRRASMLPSNMTRQRDKESSTNYRETLRLDPLVIQPGLLVGGRG